MKVLIIDNYDSFTYNLYQYIGEILMKNGKPFELDVLRNDEITINDITQKKYDKILISPGPGDPNDKAYFGICSDVILQLGENTPILGVCLGMQGIASCFGGNIIRAKVPMHGKTSIISHDGKGVFDGLPQNIEVMRYHSLIVDENNLPDCLYITAVIKSHSGTFLTGEENIVGEIMGLRHKTFPIEGIQFHPESFATEAGKQMLGNFINKKYG